MYSSIAFFYRLCSKLAFLFTLAEVLCSSSAFATTREYLYIANWPEQGMIGQFSIGTNGALTPLTPPSVGAPNVTFLAVDSSNRYLYASIIDYSTPATIGAVAQFAIGRDGTLAPLNSPFVPNLVGVGWVGADPVKPYVFAWTESLLPFAVGVGGGLTPLNGGVPAGGYFYFDPTGRYIYAITPNATGIAQFSVGPTGSLASNPPVVENCAQSLGVDPTGTYAYVNDFGLNCNGPDLIYQYVIGPGGALSPQTPPTLPIPSRAASFA